MKRTIDIDLVPAAGYTDGEQPCCPFVDCNGAIMQYDGCGELVCPDCGISALTVEEIMHEMVTAAQAVLG